MGGQGREGDAVSPEGRRRDVGGPGRLNDTHDIDRSYEQLASGLRAQQEWRRSADSRGAAPRSNDKESAQQRVGVRPFEPLGHAQPQIEGYNHSPQRREILGLHAREVSFQQTAAQRGVRLTHETSVSRGVHHHGQDDRLRYASGSPVRPGEQATNLGGQRRPTHYTEQSSEHLGLVRSHKSSQRSRSLDLGPLEHRSSQGQSSRRLRSLRKVDRMRQPREGRQDCVLDFNGDSTDKHPVRDHGLAFPYDHSADACGRAPRSHDGGAGAEGRMHSSPRFSQHHDAKGSRAAGAITIVDRSRPSQRAPRLRQASNSSQQRYITPTHSQLSDGRPEEPRPLNPHQALQMQLHELNEDEPTHGEEKNASQQVALGNMHFNTQDLIRMTQHSHEGGRSQGSEDGLRTGAGHLGRTAGQTQEAAWNVGLADSMAAT